MTWLAIYPAITLVLWALEPLGLFELPLPLRTLVLTAVLAPAMSFVLLPGLTRILGSWASPPVTSFADLSHLGLSWSRHQCRAAVGST